MAHLELKNINKIFGEGTDAAHIIKNANLTIEKGEFVVFVGPSGCGKSTMLRMIAGLESISSGDLVLNQNIVNQLSPAQRGVGMVFQSYALYPHMTVRENIAFGVKYTRKWTKEQVKKAVNDIAEALELTQLLDHKPNQMSGGQRQRVAIGRALVRQPNVFLLDEPLSNLDAALRVRMRMQIAQFHNEFKSTTIYVTHDQVEAMTLADKVVLLNKGMIEQVGTPLELYHFPASMFVAEFIGSPKMNIVSALFIKGTNQTAIVNIHGMKVEIAADATDLKPGQKLYVGIRPEDVELCTQEQERDLLVKVAEKELLGSESVLYTTVEGETDKFLIRSAGTIQVASGETLRVKLPKNACHLFTINGSALPRSVSLEQLVTDYH